MPLQPALLARLKKRGIIKEREEVIAENYEKEEEKKEQEQSSAGAPGCPNKYNPYHTCTEYCHDHWREGAPENRLSESYNRRRLRMLKKYPLPEGWTEVYDAGVARHYYWCPETDEVSWLSPRHPHAVIGEAAPKIARELFKDKMDNDRNIGVISANEEGARRPGKPTAVNEREKEDAKKKDKEVRKRGREQGSDSEEDKRPEKPEMSERDRLKRARRKGIDPMDPAAYSDVSQGKWSSGLMADNHSGVDTTAGGPLFQMRPYPAPGAVMRGKKKPDEAKATVMLPNQD